MTSNLRPAPAWKPGQSGNPVGRPKGSRNRLTEDFLADVHEAWQERGKAAINAMAEDHPDRFCLMVASLVPKNIDIGKRPADPFDGMTIEAIMEVVERAERLAGLNGPNG